MNWRKEIKRVVISSLVTSGLIFSYLLIKYLITSQVVAETSVKITSNWILTLPWSISSWWKILVGPIGSIILVAIFIMVDKTDDVSPPLSYLFGLFYGFVFWLFFSSSSSLMAVTVVSVASGIFVAIFAMICEDSPTTSVLSFGFAAGLIFGLLYGPAFGFILASSYSLCYGLIAGLFVFCFLILPLCLKYIFNPDFRYRFKRWGKWGVID